MTHIFVYVWVFVFFWCYLFKFLNNFEGCGLAVVAEFTIWCDIQRIILKRIGKRCLKLFADISSFSVSHNFRSRYENILGIHYLIQSIFSTHLILRRARMNRWLKCRVCSHSFNLLKDPVIRFSNVISLAAQSFSGEGLCPWDLS